MSTAGATPSAQDLLKSFVSSDPDAELRLDTDALYIVLTLQSTSNAWHWALYLHVRETYGLVFHISSLGARGIWEYRCDESRDMIYSQSAISVVKIADMGPEMHEALHRRIGLGSRPAIPLIDTVQFGRLTCRTWVLQALYELDNEGYISVRPGYSIRDLEQEALSLASNNSYLMEERRAKPSELQREMESACCLL